MYFIFNFSSDVKSGAAGNRGSDTNADKTDVSEQPAGSALGPDWTSDLHLRGVEKVGVGVASSIPVRSHTFVKIDHKMISTVILLPLADSFKKGCCQLQAKVCSRITG